MGRDGEAVLTDGGLAADAEWSELLAAAQRGDADAYRRFLRSITPFARAVARRRSWSEDATEDVVQDVLLTIHRIRHTYEPGRPVKPWLAAIVARRSIDALRRRARVAKQEVHDPGGYETYADPGANKEHAGEAARAVARLTKGLPPAQKEAIELMKIRELTLAEAAAASGQSIASLKVNVHRAMKKLRAGLAGDRRE